MSSYFSTTLTFSIVTATVFASAVALGLHLISTTQKGKQTPQTPYVDPLKPFFKLTETDSYKGDHSDMLLSVRNQNIQNIQCYFSTRKGSKGDEETAIFVGLQPLLMKLANTRITTEEINRLETVFKRGAGLGTFNRTPWDFVVNECEGILPIEIFALEEGKQVPRGVPVFKIQSTRPEFASAVGFLEPLLSHVWFPMTVATKCHELKQDLLKFASKTGTSKEHVEYMLHDFGVRGASSMESAERGGLGHLCIFRGTDNLPAVDAVDEFYGMESTNESPGCSVNATEHSVMTAQGRDGQFDSVAKLLHKYKKGILSVVIDSYDQSEFVNEITRPVFFDLVTKRDGKLVLRPDSGEPTDVLRMILKTFQRNLSSQMTRNEKGYFVLPKGYGLIFGDGLNKKKIIELLDVLFQTGFSVENIVFGAGGALLQKGLDEHGMNRDTLRCSYKLCAIQTLQGKWISVYKDPIDGKTVVGESKASLRGRQKVVYYESRLITVCEDDGRYTEYPDEMRLVYGNGKLFNKMSFDAVRRNVCK
jgi:nicotinamide phosphoribosyltransferase